MKKSKEVRKKKFYFRSFLKELKRVRWNAEKNLLKSLAIAVVFITITILLFTSVALLTQSWFSQR